LSKKKNSDKEIWLLWLGAVLGALFAKFFDVLVSAGNATVVRNLGEADWFYAIRVWGWAILVFLFATFFVVALLASRIKRVLEA
jgi:hypothetical protein